MSRFPPAQRQGFTLIEVMVVIAVMAVVVAVALPTLSGLLDLQQRASAKELAQTYTWLIDEAQLRNVTFRVAYNLDRSTWKVEVGDPETLVFSTPDEREKYDEELKDQMSRYTKREVEAGVEDLRDDEESAGVQRFEGLSDSSFETENELEGGCRFAFVYTPQYGEDGMTPSDVPPEDPEEEHIAYSYVFPDGSAEHTVVRIVGEDDPEDGYTLEVEPLSGKVHLSTELVDPKESMSWVPTEGPQIR